LGLGALAVRQFGISGPVEAVARMYLDTVAAFVIPGY